MIIYFNDALTNVELNNIKYGITENDGDIETVVLMVNDDDDYEYNYCVC